MKKWFKRYFVEYKNRMLQLILLHFILFLYRFDIYYCLKDWQQIFLLQNPALSQNYPYKYRILTGYVFLALSFFCTDSVWDHKLKSKHYLQKSTLSHDYLYKIRPLRRISSLEHPIFVQIQHEIMVWKWYFTVFRNPYTHMVTRTKIGCSSWYLLRFILFLYSFSPKNIHFQH